ncbi:hypothetical protein [Bacillus cereus]|uniref:hypothetical protein n=1 Tax=Bacillus cereus TaxID=1396 RepID=UPI000BFA3631|nr:hypothetical protein [Bacillus cereus]PFL36704.1 hypothetical protein COJ06_16520 [Bacillus cereus]PGQ67142.1 hypothetical protein COA27_25320 [Bacillus cereus]
MSEQQQFEGERWTTQTIKILTELGWRQVGCSNFDIPCENKSMHGTGKSAERRNDHGVDSLFTYHDPYLNENLNIIVESKKRVWSGINTSNLDSFVKQLYTTIECANVSQKIHELGCEGVNTGLLMIWCDELDKYNHDKVIEHLSKVKLPQKKKPITLYVATNHEILKWSSLIEYKAELERDCEEFNYFYPSDFYRRVKSMSTQKGYLNLIQLYSSYIFAKSRKKVEMYGMSKVIDINHVFFFAEPTKKELEFMYQLLKDFQFEDADEINIHFYGQQIKFREHIAEFIRSKREYFKLNESQLQINIKYMNELKTVPEKYNVKEEG